MILWIDAQLSPYLASWLTSECGVEARAVRDLGLREAGDREIFLAAREASAIVLTRDRDFILLLELLGSPPQVLWLTIGNTSNAHLREVLSRNLSPALGLLYRDESLVEVTDRKQTT